MINFTLRDVAIKQLIIALKVFNLLILGIVFFAFFESIKCNGLVKIITYFLALGIVVSIGVILSRDFREKSEDEYERPETYIFGTLFFLIIFISITSHFVVFFYDDFIIRVFNILPYFGGYTLIYTLVISVHLLSKKIKVGYPEGLIDEYKKALEQKCEDVKFFTNDSGNLPNISDMNKNISKNINVKTL